MQGKSPVICPTVTAFSADDYREQIRRIQRFALRIHLDFMDGIFAPTVSIPIHDAWWQPGPAVDLHVMYKNPLEQLEDMVALKPYLIIVHAEAEDIAKFFNELSELGIKKGLALLQDTKVEDVAELIKLVDHVLIFSGDLGHFGGSADTDLLTKITAIHNIQPSIEIGWDGGINTDNAAILAAAGVDVLNVGGFIQMAENPEDAYDTLVASVNRGNNG